MFFINLELEKSKKQRWKVTSPSSFDIRMSRAGKWSRY